MVVKKKKASDLTQLCLAILVGLFLMFLMSWDIDTWLAIPVDHPTDFERSFMEK